MRNDVRNITTDTKEVFFMFKPLCYGLFINDLFQKY